MAIKQQKQGHFLPLFQSVDRKFVIEEYTKGKSNHAMFEKMQIENSLKVKAEQVSMFDFLDIAFPNAKGYFCVFQKGNKKRRQDFITKDEIVKKLTGLFEHTFGMNAYVSYSTYFTDFRGYHEKDEPVSFMVDGKRIQSTACDITTKTEYVIRHTRKKKKEVRTQENINYTYLIAQDLDFYKLGINEEKAIDIIAKLIDEQKIVCPTFVVFTGRGIQLIWSVKPFKNIQGYTHDKEWREIQQEMIKIFDEVGLNPDTVVKVPSAVTRLPQTLNKKSGTLVKAFYTNSYPLTLEEMVFFHGVMPYSDRKVEPKKTKPKENIGTKQPTTPNKVSKLLKWNEFTLNRYREEDIFIFTREAVKKGYDIVGKRTWLSTVLCFHALVSSGGDASYAHKRFLEFWNLLTELKIDYDNSFEEMEQRVQMATKYYDDWVNDTWDKEKYVCGGLFYKNITMLEYLGIVEDYYLQWKMNTIKIRNKKYDAARKHFERLESGQIQGTMAEYNERRKQDKEHLLDMLRRHLEKNPKAKRKDLAELLGVDPSYISKLKKEI